MPKALKYESTKGHTNELAMRVLMDQVLPHDITWVCYEDHHHIMPLNESNKVRYLPERVLRQFGYVQSIPHHPESAANIITIVEQVDQH
jgi:hypothetical protein